jgi:hypothetical protein
MIEAAIVGMGRWGQTLVERQKRKISTIGRENRLFYTLPLNPQDH